MLGRKLSLQFAKFLCKYRGKHYIDTFETTCDGFHRKLNNVNFDMQSNGELRVLKILSKKKLTVFFDVGANNGSWSELVLSMFSENITIHAFEIVPETYEYLRKFASKHNNLIIQNKGLSDEKGIIPINVGKHSVAATANKIEGMSFHDDFYSSVVDCEVIKASSYLKEHKIKEIDFVKIDVEGMDLKVIKGFDNELKNIKVIQFEYGIFNIASHDLLIDFYNYLRKMGFVVGKIFPRYVDFFEYNFEMENFHGSNFIAIKENEKELINQLANYQNYE